MTAAARAAPGDPGGLPRAEKPAGAVQNLCLNQNTSAACDAIYNCSRLDQWSWNVIRTPVSISIGRAAVCACNYAFEM